MYGPGCRELFVSAAVMQMHLADTTLLLCVCTFIGWYEKLLVYSYWQACDCKFQPYYFYRCSTVCDVSTSMMIIVHAGGSTAALG